MNSNVLTMTDAQGRQVPFMFEENAPAPAAEGERSFDLRSLWFAVRRSRWLLVAALLVALAGGLAVTMLTRPIYRATTTVQIEQQSSRVMASGQDASGDALDASADADRFLQTQLDILHSRSLAERVVATLGLDRSPRFLHDMGVRTRADEDVRPPAIHGLVVALVQSNMRADLPRNSRVAEISFSGPDPSSAAAIANAYADDFIVGNLQRKYDASSYARGFLQKQLVDAKQRLEDAERASIAYARSAGLIETSDDSSAQGPNGGGGGQGGHSLVTSSLGQTNSALSGAVQARIAAQQRWQRAQATPMMSLPEVQNNTAIQSLVQQRAVAQANYEQQREQHKADYPAMRQLAAQITELDAQISRLASYVKTSIHDQYLVAQQQENALSGRLNSLRGQTLSEQDRGVRLNILRREVDTDRTLYDGLLQRYKEVSAAAGITANNVSVVDRALPPSSPVLPRPFLNLAIAALAGLLLGLALVLARETFDDAIRSPDDIDRKLGIAFLGTIPRLHSDETPREALASPRSAFSEAYYALRSSLEFASVDGLPRSLLATSSQPGEGKSTTAASLAEVFARVGRRVILIDVDLRKPSLHHALSLPSAPGLTNVLTGQMPVEKAIQNSGSEHLDFLAAGPLPPNPAELLAGGALRHLIEVLGKSYDLVVMDGPPVMGLADAPQLATLVEGVIFVTEAGRAHRGQAKAALRRLRGARAHILGAVLTKFDAKTAGDYGDYGYSYSYGAAGTDKTDSNGLRDWLRQGKQATRDQADEVV